MTFTGNPQGLAIMDQVGASTKEEFTELRPRWERDVMAPSKLFVAALGPQLQERVSPSLEFAPKVNGSIAPVNKDVRFAEDKSRPYKDYVLLRFWEPPNKKDAAMVGLRLGGDGVGISVGQAFTPRALARFRALLPTAAGAEIAGLVASAQADTPAVLAEPELKRPALDLPADSPARRLACA